MREGRYRDALDRAERAILDETLGRKQAGRLHNLIFKIYTEDLSRICPTAVLHGEEAVRLAELVRDPWLKCEALARLIETCCQAGDIAGAVLRCREVEMEVARNQAVITGGLGALFLLKATIAEAEGDWDRALAAWDQAEANADYTAPAVLATIRTRRAMALLEQHRPDEAQAVLERQACPENSELAVWLEYDLALAWLVLEESRPQEAAELLESLLDRAITAGCEGIATRCLGLKALLNAEIDPGAAQRLANRALARAMGTGRRDLVLQLQRWVGPLLPA